MGKGFRCDLVHMLTAVGIFAFKLVTAFPIAIRPRSLPVYCGKASWQTIVFFYILNYGTHAMTIKSFPGDRTWKYIAWMVAALLVPFSGILRGCFSISRGKDLYETDIQHAARAGALCVLARSQNWKPRPGESIRGYRIHGSTALNVGDTIKGSVKVGLPKGMCRVTPKMERIHGQITGLSSEYEIHTLPTDAKVTPLLNGKIELCKSHNVLKWLAAIIQLLFACFTLYRTRGAQVHRYGYAAFGFTVIPYAIMSLVNLIANVLNPEYPCLYLVRSRVMREAESRQPPLRVSGTIGTMVELGGEPLTIETVSRTTDKGVRATFRNPGNLSRNGYLGVEVTVPAIGRYQKEAQSWSTFFYLVSAWIIGILALAAPYVIVGGWTRFDHGSSTLFQRGWIMTWIVGGQIFGIILGLSLHDLEGKWELWLIMIIIWAIFGGAPAIVGFTVVGEMMNSYNSTCVLGV